MRGWSIQKRRARDKDRALVPAGAGEDAQRQDGSRGRAAGAQAREGDHEGGIKENKKSGSRGGWLQVGSHFFFLVAPLKLGRNRMLLRAVSCQLRSPSLSLPQRRSSSTLASDIFWNAMNPFRLTRSNKAEFFAASSRKAWMPPRTALNRSSL